MNNAYSKAVYHLCLACELWLWTSQTILRDHQFFSIQSVLDSPIELQPWSRARARASRPRKRGVGASRASSNQVQNRGCWLQCLWQVECQIINLVLVNLPIPIQFIPRRPLKFAFRLPRNTRDAPQVPSDQNHIFGRLPNSQNIQRYLPKQNSAMKPQRPKYQFVFLNPGEGV